MILEIILRIAAIGMMLWATHRAKRSADAGKIGDGLVLTVTAIAWMMLAVGGQ